MKIPVSVRHRVVCQQDLRHVNAKRLECIFVGAHEQGLARRRGGLQQGDLLRTVGEAEPLSAKGDCAGGNDDHLAAGLDLGGDLCSHFGKTAPFGAEGSAADLDYQPLAVA